MSDYSGFLVVDKPSGVTSFSMVSLARKLTGVRRVGHAGTLDPLASGVLPVAVGQATRLIEYLDDEGKAYTARVRLGESTDTYDAEGSITARCDAAGITRGAVESALLQFVGEIEQRPPLYSAIKVAGKPLYRYARAGEAVAVASRTVRIDSIDLLSFAQGIVELSVHCGKGTYIRSLAHDLGECLGCGAHLVGLVRLHSGGFAIEDAHRPDELAAAAGEGRLADLLLAPDRAVEGRPAAILGATHSEALAAGRDLALRARGGSESCRAYSVAGAFLGMLGRRESGLWHPQKVFAAPETPNFD